MYFHLIWIAENLNGTVTQAADVAIHADVVQVVFGCLDLASIALRRVIKSEHVLLTK